VSSLQRQVIEARNLELDLQINSKLLEAEAKKRQTNTMKLLEEEVISKVKDPTEAEVQGFYDQNKHRIQVELKDVRSDIIQYLRNEREREEASKFAERLRTAAEVKVIVQDVVRPTSPEDRARVLATVNGERITSDDIESSLRPLIFNVQEQVYTLRQRELDLRINDFLLRQEAQKRKVTIDALLDTEVASKVKPATEADALSFYEQNKERLDGDFAKVKDQVIEYLHKLEIRNAEMAFAEQLHRTASIQTFLARPAPPVYKIATDDQPSLGSQNAAVTIVEFTDYQCLACAAANLLMEKVLKEYDGRVRLVVRDFPLEQHADAF
jgi:hypothetical protein